MLEPANRGGGIATQLITQDDAEAVLRKIKRGDLTGRKIQFPVTETETIELIKGATQYAVRFAFGPSGACLEWHPEEPVPDAVMRLQKLRCPPTADELTQEEQEARLKELGYEFQPLTVAGFRSVTAAVQTLYEAKRLVAAPGWGPREYVIMLAKLCGVPQGLAEFFVPNRLTGEPQ